MWTSACPPYPPWVRGWCSPFSGTSPPPWRSCTWFRWVMIWQHRLFWAPLVSCCSSKFYTRFLHLDPRWLENVLRLTMFKLCFQLVLSIREKQAWNPLNPATEPLIVLRQKIVQNSIEQTSLFVAFTFLLVSYLTESEMKIVPLLVMHHCIGRIVFAHG